jgi:hypothetical protein
MLHALHGGCHILLMLQALHYRKHRQYISPEIAPLFIKLGLLAPFPQSPRSNDHLHPRRAAIIVLIIEDAEDDPRSIAFLNFVHDTGVLIAQDPRGWRHGQRSGDRRESMLQEGSKETSKVISYSPIHEVDFILSQGEVGAHSLNLAPNTDVPTSKLLHPHRYPQPNPQLSQQPLTISFRHDSMLIMGAIAVV